MAEKFFKNGKLIKGDENSDDLFFAPIIEKCWGIVYRNAERLFDTREEAEKWMEEADEGEKSFAPYVKSNGRRNSYGEISGRESGYLLLW